MTHNRTLIFFCSSDEICDYCLIDHLRIVLCKMSRYYNADDDAAAAEVYKITEKKVEAAKRWPKSGKVWSRPEKAKKRKRRTGEDPFPGKAPVDPEALERHDRGPGVDDEAVKQMKTKFARKEMKRR